MTDIEDPSVEEIMAMLGQTYTPEGVVMVMESRIGALGKQRPRVLVETIEGRREVYAWALGLADGVMG